MSEINYAWRAEFSNREINALHGEAFGIGDVADEDRDWAGQVARHSMGWVAARSGEHGPLVGFVNVVTDGRAHAWIQDVMVARAAQRSGVGVRMVAEAREQCRVAGCDWLHVDFAKELAPFYFDACGFSPTEAGLIRLS